MSKARLSQIATTWMGEDDNLRKKRTDKKKNPREMEEHLKKKQTFSLEIDTIKRLWMHRVKTNKTISSIIDELVIKNVPNWK